MGKIWTIVAALLVFAPCAQVSASETVTRADLQAIMERLAKLEAENRAQAARIAELEGRTPAEKPAAEMKRAQENSRAMASSATALEEERGVFFTWMPAASA